MPDVAGVAEVVGVRHVEHVMGTTFSLDVRDAFPMREDALADVVQWLHWVDSVFSTYKEHSAINRLARGEVRLRDCPVEVGEVLDACAELAVATDGYFTALPGGRLDPSGYVKGWSIQRASDMLRAAGSANHCVNGGGDVQVVGLAGPETPWRVGVSHPLRPHSLLTVVEGSDLAVATSGTSERGGHVLDPYTGRPATALVSLTVIGRAIAETDAYATAGLAMGARAIDWLNTMSFYEAIAVDSVGATRTTTKWSRVVALPHQP